MSAYSNKTGYNYVWHQFNGTFVKEVVLGKIIQIIPSLNVQYYHGQNQGWEDKYRTSEEMYYPVFRNLVISRRHKLAKNVKY